MTHTTVLAVMESIVRSPDGAVPEKIAAGFFLYRRVSGEFRYLLLWNAKREEPGFPKGHADPGETRRMTAHRETWEETGIDDIAPGAHFERRMRYPVKGRLKEVSYFLAETHVEDVTLSREHSRSQWAKCDEVCEALTHENLRAVFLEAAAYLKDPALRRGLSPAGAEKLLVEHIEAGSPVVAHTREVAAVARVLAETCEGVDADFVEACAWLHDIGRSRTHGERHPIEGFQIVSDAGHPGYAPACLSHYTKGRPVGHLGLSEALAAEMNAACDLDTLTWEEALVVLADSMVAGSKRVTLEARRDDLVRRYEEVAFFEHAHRAAREMRTLFEARTGRDLYVVAGLNPAG